MKKSVLRTCVLCRDKLGKKDLYRIVRDGDKVIYDRTGKVNGRGAYVCGNDVCLEKLKKTNAIDASLKINTKPEDRALVVERIKEDIK